MKRDVRNCLSLVLFGMLLLSFGACDDSNDEGLLPENISKGDKLLKSVWTSFDGDSKNHINALYYYDENDRLLKVEYPGVNDLEESLLIGYEEYHYTTNGHLEKIVFFTNNVNEGYINLRTHTFTYSEQGSLIERTTTYPIINESERTTFSYDNGLLAKEHHYNRDGKLQQTMEYIYNKKKQLVKQLLRDAEGTLFETREKTYQEGLLVSCNIYRGKKKEIHMRKIHYTYDQGNNLLKEVSKELYSASSLMNHTLLYEYYE